MHAATHPAQSTMMEALTSTDEPANRASFCAENFESRKAVIIKNRWKNIENNTLWKALHVIEHLQNVVLW